METVGLFQHLDEIPQLLALDEPARCSLCRTEETAAAHATLAELARWWLSPAQRALWRTDTVIQGQQRPDRMASDALFRLLPPGRESPVPVLLVITQHWEGKQHPHSQLFVPSKQELNASARSSGVADSVAALIKAAEAGTERLRRDDRRGISLHEPLSPEDLQTVQRVISDLVQGLVQLPWTPDS